MNHSLLSFKAAKTVCLDLESLLCRFPTSIFQKKGTQDAKRWHAQPAIPPPISLQTGRLM